MPGGAIRAEEQAEEPADPTGIAALKDEEAAMLERLKGLTGEQGSDPDSEPDKSSD